MALSSGEENGHHSEVYRNEMKINEAFQNLFLLTYDPYLYSSTWQSRGHVLASTLMVKSPWLYAFKGSRRKALLVASKRKASFARSYMNIFKCAKLEWATI